MTKKRFSVKDYLKYENGSLWWINPTSKRVKVGDRFGTAQTNGYRKGYLKGKRYLEHRLIWFYHYGSWPKGQIHHINSIKDDNRIENLQDVTPQQNCLYKSSDTDSTSKYRGVSWCKHANKWKVSISINRKQQHLGYFTNEVDAHKAYESKRNG